MQVTEEAACDGELIGRCLADPHEAAPFDALYGRHAGPVLAFARGLSRGDEHAARDALQETFLRFLGALPAFDRGRPVRPWLLRIARNVCLDQQKRASHRSEVPHGPEALGELAVDRQAGAPPDLAERREAAGLLRRAVEALPPDELAVFVLKHDLGQTYEQAADVLACSVRTAKYRMRSALERLGREAERLGVRP
ncbi:MAG: RNA polymerase sigma factor [Planctomycetes bacterium]|nr:RNA polymerase sigma factor [Planctomycetota bacterium]